MQSREAAWRLALRIYKGAKDDEARKLFVDYWDRSLDGSEQEFALQMDALSDVWDSSLLTTKLWRMFDETKSDTVIVSISHVLGLRGDKSDLEKLRARAGAISDRQMRNTVSSDIQRMENRLVIRQPTNY